MQLCGKRNCLSVLPEGLANMLQLRAWKVLSGGDHGWLKARHHFVFNGEGNPAHSPLGSLVIWNDDEVAARSGFPMHGHRDMEIVTYVREGVLRHEDDAGGGGVITAGNVQAISAGRGVRHAEYNPGDEVLKIFQIWLKPRRRGFDPRWASKSFPGSRHAGVLVPLASGFPEDAHALQIDADARVLGATLEAGQHIDYPLLRTRFGYLVPARGSVTVNGQRVGQRDGLAIREESGILIAATEDAEIVFVDAG
jgi:redox-sensitive bicupin YhaK (pirin superfamily)